MECGNPPKKVPDGLPEEQNDATDQGTSANKVMRWPLYLPNGDAREIQVPEIKEDSPVYAYSLIPGAGTVYGIGILQTRIQHIHSVLNNYMPTLRGIVDPDKSEDYHNGLLKNDPHGLAILEAEYISLRLKSKESTGQSTMSMAKPGATRLNLSGAQLVFGMDQEEPNWIIDDVNIETGQLGAIGRQETSYYVWIGEGPKGLYREYRIDERWIWNSYSSEYLSEREEYRNATKFYDYALANGGEFIEKWKLVVESRFASVDSLFCVFAANPKRGMVLFAQLNFSNCRKWHAYKPAGEHMLYRKGELGRCTTTKLDDIDLPNWKKSIEHIAKDLFKMNASERKKLGTDGKPMEDVGRREAAIKLAYGYAELNDHCMQKKKDLKDVESIKTLPQYIKFAKTVDECVPILCGADCSVLDSVLDFQKLVIALESFKKKQEIEENQLSEKLTSYLTEVSLMHERFNMASTVVEYIGGIKDEANKEMLTRLFLKCLEYKKELSSFEKSYITMIKIPELREDEAVLKRYLTFQSKPLLTHSDRTLMKNFDQIQRQNARRLNLLNANIRTETIELGFDEFRVKKPE